MSMYYKDSREKILTNEERIKAIEEGNALFDSEEINLLKSYWFEETDKKSEAVMKIYKNRINKERGMSNKQAKEATGYIIQSMKRTTINIDREYKELFQTILTTPYKCEDFSFDEVRKMFMEDVFNKRVPKMKIKVSNEEVSFEYGFYTKVIQEGFKSSNGKYHNSLEMKDMIEENNVPIMIDVSINRDFYQISFYTFKPTF